MTRLRLLKHWLHRRYLLWCIEGDVGYLKACAVDGLIDSLSLRAFRSQIAEREARLLSLDADSRRLRAGMRMEMAR